MIATQDTIATAPTLAAALLQADAAIRQFLLLWIQNLPDEQRIRLADWFSGGLALGLDAVVVGTLPAYAIALVDGAGGRTTLATLAPDMPGADTSRVH